MFRIENLSVDFITSDILLNFHHNQIIRRKYVNINNKWEITDYIDTENDRYLEYLLV